LPTARAGADERHPGIAATLSDLREDKKTMTRLSAAFLITVALSGTALAQGAPGDARFCQSYAANVSGMGGLAIKKNPACLDYSKGVHGDFKMHYDWCMRTPASSVQGAEANIRRLVSACTGNARPAAGGSPSRAAAGVEPFGAGFDGWKFTQEPAGEGRILCRAWLGQHSIERRTDARMAVTLPAGRIVRGDYPETFFRIGNDSEPVMARSDGKRFWMISDEGFLNKLAAVPGFDFRTGPVKGKHISGRVSFNGSTARVLKELQACSKANGGH
jgi:hypothetical protein